MDKEEWDKVQMAELKHGRLAMLGVVGCLVQELVTGEGPVEQLLNGNVRGRTTEMEKGRQGGEGGQSQGSDALCATFQLSKSCGASRIALLCNIRHYFLSSTA